MTQIKREKRFQRIKQRYKKFYCKLDSKETATHAQCNICPQQKHMPQIFILSKFSSKRAQHAVTTKTASSVNISLRNMGEIHFQQKVQIPRVLTVRN